LGSIDRTLVAIAGKQQRSLACRARVPQGTLGACTTSQRNHASSKAFFYMRRDMTSEAQPLKREAPHYEDLTSQFLSFRTCSRRGSHMEHWGLAEERYFRSGLPVWEFRLGEPRNESCPAWYTATGCGRRCRRRRRKRSPLPPRAPPSQMLGNSRSKSSVWAVVGSV
jgi:hypothetical protein